MGGYERNWDKRFQGSTNNKENESSCKPQRLRISTRNKVHILSWVAGNEVIVKNVNANIPVSLSWLLRPFLARLSFASLAQLNSLLQVRSGLIQFPCKSEAALVCGFVDEGSLAFAEKLN